MIYYYALIFAFMRMSMVAASIFLVLTAVFPCAWALCSGAMGIFLALSGLLVVSLTVDCFIRFVWWIIRR